MQNKFSFDVSIPKLEFVQRLLPLINKTEKTVEDKDALDLLLKECKLISKGQ